MACCGGHRNRPAVCYPCPGLLKYFHLGFFSEKVLPKRIGFVTSSGWIRHKNTSQSLHLLKEAPRTAGFDVQLSSSSLTWRSRSELTAPSCRLWPDPSQPQIDFMLQERSLGWVFGEDECRTPPGSPFSLFSAPGILQSCKEERSRAFLRLLFGNAWIQVGVRTSPRPWDAGTGKSGRQHAGKAIRGPQ